jgi:hypothetical protein
MKTRINYWIALNYIRTNIKTCRTQHQKNVIIKMLDNTFRHFAIDERKLGCGHSQLHGWGVEFIETQIMLDNLKISC